jgi:hypothetical protein
MKRLIILAIAVGLITASCRKDIHLNLQNAAGILIIEGNINDQPGPYTVQLSRTVTFYDSNTVIPASGAGITISDDLGNKDSLIEVSPGHYETSTIQGVAGRTYHLHVNADSKQYDATSTMLPPVPIDSLGINSSFFSTSPRGFIQFADPAGVVNYYKTTLYLSQFVDSAHPFAHPRRQTRLVAISDRLSDGITIQSTLRADYDINPHDTLRAELDAIDKPVYDYWYTLNNSTLSSQTAAPANPPSNISNGALGYFSAYSATYSHHIVYDGQLQFHRID